MAKRGRPRKDRAALVTQADWDSIYVNALSTSNGPVDLLTERGTTHGMSQAEYLEVFRELTETMYATTKAKNSDYTGDSSDPFKNFRAVEQMGVASAEQGFFTRMTDKLMRLGSFIRKGTLQVADEKIEETLIDLATYCLLMVCYLKDKNR